MADPNNIPQEAGQLAEDLNSQDRDTRNAAKSEVAITDFEKEYRIAQQNNNGSGTQSSDPIAVTRQSGEASAGGSQIGHSIHSPGDSDPNDYLDMAKDITKNVKMAAE